MLASSRKPCHTANPRRRAKSLALHCGRDRAAADERLLSVKHAGGLMRSSAPAQRRAAACHTRRCCMPALPCRAGVHARRKGLRRPGRILARQSAAPLRLRRAAHLPPLAGEALPPVCPALQGGVTTPAGEGRTGAALAGLRRHCPSPPVTPQCRAAVNRRHVTGSRPPGPAPCRLNLVCRAHSEFCPPAQPRCRFVKHLVQREIQRKQQVFLSERARQEGA